MITAATYQQYLKRIDELLKTVGNNTPINHPDFIELNHLSDLVADYEEAHFPEKQQEIENEIAVWGKE